MAQLEKDVGHGLMLESAKSPACNAIVGFVNDVS